MPERLVKRIADDFNLGTVVATEIEFYLRGIAAKFTPDEVVAHIQAVCAQQGIALACAEAERGPDQYEISLLPTHDVNQIVADTDRFKELMTETFAPYGIKADFTAKPSPDVPGCGLHVHVHLEDASGRNVFFREGDTFSPLLLYSIGGLLMLMNPCMPVFAPTEASYLRFSGGPNPYLVCPTATNVPTKVSWGTNNRTVAVRLPNKAMDNKHIEHRVAGADADVGSVIAAILAGMHYGLKEKCDPGEPIYGDASLAQYALPSLARSLAEAQRFRMGCKMLEDYESQPY